ncbi:hypothetical protein [Dactylosporangium sp. NPDC051484]|uniref:hypothetical protein n=1 Tax=Dactylosporangium sp. NPDC051484 TaxID=3154942 RepID=UPI00344CF400
MNRNTVRLMAAVVAGWLVAALGGLAVVPYSAFAYVFVAVLAVPTLVAFWDPERLFGRRWGSDSPPGNAADHEADVGVLVQIALGRYRPVWLIVTMALGLAAAMVNMVGGFAATVVAIDGEPVHATRVRLERTKRLRDPGYHVECVLARPDGTRIPGGLPVPDGDTCGETEDVIVDPHGLVDPVRQRDDPAGSVGVQVLALGAALLSCVPAARPRPSPPARKTVRRRGGRAG